MDKQKIEIIKRVLMLSTLNEVEKVNQNVIDAISRECDQDDHDQELFTQWKEEKRINGAK